MEEIHALELMFQKEMIIISGRISRVKNLNIDTTKNIFSPFKLYIISEETSKKDVYHQHFVVGDYEITELQITELIRKSYPDLKGNKCVYVKIARNPKQLMKYTLKEGKFITKGFSKSFIDDACKMSRSKEHMKDEFIALEERLILKKIGMRKFMEDYIRLKVMHAQPLYDNHLIAYFKRMAIQSGELNVEDYSGTLYSRVFFLG